MAPVTLPPSFYNSFWSPDYRSGLEVLFKNLEQGCLEDEDVADFIESQIKAHSALSATLLAPPLPSNPSQSSSSSLQHTLLSLRGASSARGEAHRALALELEQRVLSGFRQWKDRHEERIRAAREEILSKTGVIGVFEKDVQKLQSLRQTYLTKSRQADDSEDDARYAPSSSPNLLSPVTDNYTSSPKPHNAALRRSGTVADRISEKLRAASISSPPRSGHKTLLSIDGKILPSPPTPLRPSTPVNESLRSPTSPNKEEGFIPPSEPNGRPVMHTAPPAVPNKDSPQSPFANGQPQPVLLSGLSLSAKQLEDLLLRLDAYLLTTPAPYADPPGQPTSRSNAALASRQRSTILGTYEKTFSGEEAVEWLKEHMEGFGGDWERCADAARELHAMGHLSRAGVGRGFEPSEDIYYILKMKPSETTSALLPSTSAQLQQVQSKLKSYLPSALAHSDEPSHVRLRRDAIKADEAYREGVKWVEEKRLEVEERIERGLRMWERWERERLGIVKSVLKAYDEALSRLPARLNDLTSSTALSIEAYNPEADLKALIEGNRTGPFRPHPFTYESIEADIPDVNFGIDLRKWSGESGWKSMVGGIGAKRDKGAVPEILGGLLEALEEMYTKMPDDERRRAWIYEVPLHETHALRNAINNPALSIDDVKRIALRYNAPITAGTVKLWLLELNPPVLGWEGWEDAKAVYPSVGADQERDMTSAVISVLGRLPGIQLYALDAVVKHFRQLIDSTKSQESSEVYVTKLALSVGRCILRPQYETELTIGDRTPSLLLVDLITSYSALIPSLVEKKIKESDRVMPVRKGTALVDQRISRSRLSGEGLTERAQQLHQTPRPTSPSPENTTPPTVTSTIAKAPEIVTAAATAVITPLASALGLGMPIMKEPIDDDDDVPRSTAVTVVPPTPEPTRSDPLESAQLPDQAVPEIPEDDVLSPTAAILDQMESTGGAEDSPVSTGLGGLKRATSGEVSRLRGPRVARGPRPPPGRVPSHSGAGSIASLTSVTGGTEAEAGEGESGRITPTQGSVNAGGAGGDYAARRGKPTVGAGAFGHSTRGSVSQAIAQFEKKGRATHFVGQVNFLTSPKNAFYRQYVELDKFNLVLRILQRQLKIKDGSIPLNYQMVSNNVPEGTKPGSFLGSVHVYSFQYTDESKGDVKGLLAPTEAPGARKDPVSRNLTTYISFVTTPIETSGIGGEVEIFFNGLLVPAQSLEEIINSHFPGLTGASIDSHGRNGACVLFDETIKSLPGKLTIPLRKNSSRSGHGSGCEPENTSVPQDCTYSMRILVKGDCKPRFYKTAFARAIE